MPFVNRPLGQNQPETIWSGDEKVGEVHQIQQMDATSIEDLTAEISTYGAPTPAFTTSVTSVSAAFTTQALEE